MPAHAAIITTASQNGKKPLFGPSVPQPTPRRRASQRTRSPPAISTAAVVRSAARTAIDHGVQGHRAVGTALFLQQTPLGHEVLVELLRFLHRLDVVVAGREGGLESSLLHVLLPLRGLRDLAQKSLVPVHGF